MTISLKQFPQDTTHKLDALHKQLGDDYSGNRLKIRFEDIKKPTDNLDLSMFKSEEPEASAVSKEISDDESKSPKGFFVPKNLMIYIGKLVASNPKLKMFAFDMKFADSNEQIKKLVEVRGASGEINQKQKAEMLAFLDAQPSVVVETLAPVVKAPMTKREKLEWLRKNHGIVVEHVGKDKKALGDSIIDKSTKLWKGGEGDMHAAMTLLDEGQSEENAQEEIVATPVVWPQVFPVDFEGKLLQVIRGESEGGDKNTVKVLYDNQEIARGAVTAKGVDIKIDKAFKAGFLLAPTDAERAFKVAQETLKTFTVES